MERIAKEYIHKLTNEELGFLQSLIGKSICSISSDRILLKPSSPELYSFYTWIQLSLWDNKEVFKFYYEFDEIPRGDDFITLSVTKTITLKRKSKNASIILGWPDKFTISKIEVYGDSYLADPDTTKETKVATDNIVILEDANGKKICIQCLYPYSEVNITMNKDLILKLLSGLTSVPHEGYRIDGPTLKHTIE